MNKSIKLAEEARKYLVGGVNSPIRAKVPPYPLVITQGKGSKIVDVDGKTYTDYILGYGPLVLGHSHPAVIKRIREVLEKGWLFGHTTPYEIDLARKILQYVKPSGRIRFVNSGTEATMTAIRLARGFTGRDLIVKFEGCYHGAHDSVLVKAGSVAAELGEPQSPGVPRDFSKLTIVIPYNDIKSLNQVFKEKGEKIAGVIVEPVLGNYGVIPAKKEFIKIIRELTKKYGSLLIFDEVITGFRISMKGAQDLYQVNPDLITLGKIIGGGFPVGAIVGEKKIMDELSPSGKIFNAGTFNGHPVSMAAGLAVLEELEKDGISRLHRNSRVLCESLTDSCKKLRIKCTVNCAPGMVQFFLFTDNVSSPHDIPSKALSVYYELHKRLLGHGFLVAPSQLEALFTSIIHSNEEHYGLAGFLAKILGEIV